MNKTSDTCLGEEQIFEQVLYAKILKRRDNPPIITIHLCLTILPYFALDLSSLRLAAFSFAWIKKNNHNIRPNNIRSMILCHSQSNPHSINVYTQIDDVIHIL